MIIKKLNDVAQTNDTMYEIYEEKDVKTITGETVKIPEFVKICSFDSLEQELNYTETQMTNLAEKKAKLLSYKSIIEKETV